MLKMIKRVITRKLNTMNFSICFISSNYCVVLHYKSHNVRAAQVVFSVRFLTSNLIFMSF